MSTAISRRGFAKILSASAAYAALTPSMSISAPLRLVSGAAKAVGVVRLSSNENPYGPSPLAVKAMTDAFSLAWRYPDEHQQLLVDALAKMHGVAAEQVLLGNGSAEILKVAAAAFTATGKKLVVGNPTFEAILVHAQTAQADVAKIDLTPDYAHDLPKMSAAARAAGLIYICNPNNPTASITHRDQIRSFLAKAPSQTIVLIDEAYHHYVNASARYVSFLDQPPGNDRVIVIRTFSKVYAMAGLRLGYGVTDHVLAEKMLSLLTDVDLNCTAVAAGKAALADSESVRNFVKRNMDDRQEFFNQCHARMLKPIDSVTNFLMMNAGMPAASPSAHNIR